MVKADLHFHGRTGSNIKKKDFNRISRTAAIKLGDGGVAGVVNFSGNRYERLIDSAPGMGECLGPNKNGVYIPGLDITLVKGQEIPTRDGHVLALGLEYGVHLREGRPLEDSLLEIEDSGAIAIIDHPFYFAGAGKYLSKHPKFLAKVDAIEVHNGEAAFGFSRGPLPKYANDKAREFYEMASECFPYLGALSVSDGHSLGELGSSWTEIEGPDLGDDEDFVQSLKRSVCNTSLESSMKMTDSNWGAARHIGELAWLIAMSRVPGLRG